MSVGTTFKSGTRTSRRRKTCPRAGLCPTRPVGICLPWDQHRLFLGDDINASCQHDNNVGQTSNVALRVNPWGFFDMHGNLWEWTADWYGVYEAGPLIDPTGAASGSFRVQRGGSWGDVGVRSARRGINTPSYFSTYLGFRVGFQFTGEYTADLNASVQLEMLWVEPGTFTMGSPTTETGRQTNETEHEVTLSKGFYLGKYEITQAQYEAVMTGNTVTDSDNVVISSEPSKYGGNPNRPVEQVSWEDIQVFLTRLNVQQADNLPVGWAYVLPTEAQWEYACRAGTTTAYSWGETITTDNANYLSSGYAETRDVGLYDANPWGFYDMHGNVSEWLSDWYIFNNTTYSIDPEGPLTGTYRVIRGGSFIYNDENLRSARRGFPFISSEGNIYFVGFRVGFQQVPDTESPELELFGGTDLLHELGKPWAEPGYAASDEQDGNLTGSVTISGTLDVNTFGTYTQSYTVADTAGNEANYTVRVIDSITIPTAMDLMIISKQWRVAVPTTLIRHPSTLT